MNIINLEPIDGIWQEATTPSSKASAKRHVKWKIDHLTAEANFKRANTASDYEQHKKYSDSERLRARLHEQVAELEQIGEEAYAEKQRQEQCRQAQQAHDNYEASIHIEMIEDAKYNAEENVDVGDTYKTHSTWRNDWIAEGSCFSALPYQKNDTNTTKEHTAMKTTKLQAMNNKAQLLAAKASVAEAYTQVLQAKADVQKAKAELLKQQATLAQAKYEEASLKHNISEAKPLAIKNKQEEEAPVEAVEVFNVEEATLVEPVPLETIVELPECLPEPVIAVEELAITEELIIEESVIAEEPIVVVENVPEFIEEMKAVLLPLRKQGLASDEWAEYESVLKQWNDIKKQGAIVQQQWLDERTATTLAKREEYNKQFEDIKEPAWLSASESTPSTENVLAQLEAVAAITVNITNILPDEEETVLDDEWAASYTSPHTSAVREVVLTEDDCGY